MSSNEKQDPRPMEETVQEKETVVQPKADDEAVITLDENEVGETAETKEAIASSADMEESPKPSPSKEATIEEKDVSEDPAVESTETVPETPKKSEDSQQDVKEGESPTAPSTPVVDDDSTTMPSVIVTLSGRKRPPFKYNPKKVTLRFLFANKDGLTVTIECNPGDTVGEVKGALLSVWPECESNNRPRQVQ